MKNLRLELESYAELATGGGEELFGDIENSLVSISW